MPSWRAALHCLSYALVAAQLDVGVGAVMETPLVRGASEADLAPLVARARAAIVHCSADAATLRARCAARVSSKARHPVHLDAARAAELAAALDRYGPPEIGVPVLAVDTAAGYRPSLERVTAWARRRVRG